MLTKREAQKAGRAVGLAAASWMFDGNTTDDTYRAFVDGRRDGDPKIVDQYAPREWLSGEWVGESVSELLGECENTRDEERASDVMDAYVEAADTAYWRELERVARYHLPKPKRHRIWVLCPSCGGSDGIGHCNRCGATGHIVRRVAREADSTRGEKAMGAYLHHA